MTSMKLFMFSRTLVFEASDGTGDDALEVRGQPFGEGDQGWQLVVHGQALPLLPAAARFVLVE